MQFTGWRRILSWLLIYTTVCLPVLTAPSAAQAYQYDSLTGTYYVNARNYDPNTGRWMQQDPNGTGLILVHPAAYHGQSPSIGLDINPSSQHIDGPHLYQYVMGNPVNHTDPTGMFTYGELALRAGAFAGMGAAMMGGYYAGRGALRGYINGVSPREIASAAWDETYDGFASYERTGGMLLLSAIAATGPIGAGVVAAGGIVFGGMGYVDAQTRVADAQDFNELFLSTYDGYASGIGIGASAFALQANLRQVGGLMTSRGLGKNWHKATFNDGDASLQYHWGKHAKPKGKSMEQYTQDAINFFNANKAMGVAGTLKDGTSGIKITGSPGGWFKPDGKIVTFWYD